MQRIARAFGTMLLTMTVAGALWTGATLAAQDDPEDLGIVDETTYQSPQFDVEVTWGGDWAVDEEGLESTEADGLDRLSLQNDELSATFQAIFVLAGDEAPGDYRDRLLEFREDIYPDLELLAETDGDDAATLLYAFEEEEFRYVNYAEVQVSSDESVLQITELGAWEESREDAFEATQEEIEVDGDVPFAVADEFPEVDEEATPGADETPEAEETPEPEATPEPEETVEADETPEPEVTPESEETPDVDETPEAEVDPELAELGLVAETAYESPQHGVTVEWTDEVELLDGDDPLVSDEETGDDVIRLQSVDEDFTVLVRSFPAEGSTPEDGVAFYSGDYGDQWQEFEVLLDVSTEESGAVVVQLVNDADQEVAQYIEVYAAEDGDVLVEAILTTSPDDLESAIEATQDLEVNGDAVFQTFEIDEVLDAA